MALAKERLVSLRQERKKLNEDINAVLDRSDPKTHKLSGDDEATFQRMEAAQKELKTRIEREERQAEEEEKLASPVPAADTRTKLPGAAETTDITQDKAARAAFVNYFRTGLVKPELRALSAGTDTEGGFVVVPQSMAKDILSAADAMLEFRKFATVIQLEKAESLGIPTLEADPSDPDWTGEITETDEDEDMSFGKREMKGTLVSKMLKVSNKLLRSSMTNMEAYVIKRLAYKLAVVQEKAYMVGTGALQPLGLFVISDSGIPTARNVDIGAYTALTADHLIQLQHKIRKPYRAKAQWIMHSDWVERIRKLKDAVTGQYLLRVGIELGEPDTILGKPYYDSEYAQNSTSSGARAIVYGDPSYYQILDTLGMQVQRLDELFAKTNQTGFIIRYEGDGAPVMGEAFACAKISA
jgi:HK97 family phage major capsid protein